MTCPTWPVRTADQDVSGFVSGFGRNVSGLSVDRVRLGFFDATRTNRGHVGSRCPAWAVSGLWEMVAAERYSATLAKTTVPPNRRLSPHQGTNPLPRSRSASTFEDRVAVSSQGIKSGA